MLGAMATAGLGTIMKLGAAIKQNKAKKKAGKDAKDMEAKGWNKYYTPEAFKESEAMTRNQYNDPKFMGQRVMEDKLGANTANAVSNITRTAGSGAEAMLGLGVAQNSLNKGMQDIGLNAKADMMARFNDYINMLRQKSNYQEKEWEINKWTPYQNKLAEKQALETSSRANLQNAVTDINNLAIANSLIKSGGGGGSDANGSNVSVPTPTQLGFNLSSLFQPQETNNSSNDINYNYNTYKALRNRKTNQLAIQ